MLGPTARLPEPTTLDIFTILNFLAISLSPIYYLIIFVIFINLRVYNYGLIFYVSSISKGYFMAVLIC